MRLVPPAVSLLVLGALAAPFAPAVRSLSFAPSVGTSLEKTFTTEVEIEIERFELVVNGEDQSGAIDGGGLSGRGQTFASTLVVEDTYAAVADGRPTDLVRHYESVETEASGDLAPEEGDDDVLEEVEGSSVRFQWDAESQTYDRSYEGDDGGDEDLLEKLGADLDLLALLPSREVEVGDSWSVPASRLESLLDPGHDLASQMAGDEDLEDFPVELAEILRASLEEMEVLCTFDEIVEGDGTRLGLISLDVAFDDELDLVDTILGILEGQQEMPEGMEVSVEVADCSLALQGEGTFTWNLDAGHAAALTFAVTLEVELDAAASIEMQGQVVADMEAGGAASLVLEREVKVQ